VWYIIVRWLSLGKLGKLEVFGESALLGGARNATVRAVTGRVEVLVLLQKDLIMFDQACVAGIKALAMKRKKSNSRRQLLIIVAGVSKMTTFTVYSCYFTFYFHNLLTPFLSPTTLHLFPPPPKKKTNSNRPPKKQIQMRSRLSVRN
jgi:hypothetical protein